MMVWGWGACCSWVPVPLARDEGWDEGLGMGARMRWGWGFVAKCRRVTARADPGAAKEPVFRVSGVGAFFGGGGIGQTPARRKSPCSAYAERGLFLGDVARADPGVVGAWLGQTPARGVCD
jgi:hypothetical protein